MNNLILFSIFFFICFSISEAQQSPEQLKREAEAHLSEGKLGEAIDIFNKYISAVPDEPEGYRLRGIAHEKRANYEAALRDYRSASKLQPENNEIKKDIERVRETWDKLLVNRIEGFKREIAIDNTIAKNYLEIGKSYNHLEDWITAEIWYDEYLKREEASPDEILRYTEILAKNEKYRKGEPILKRYTLKFPNDHRIWSRYGYFNLWLGNRSKAIEAFEEALRIRPYFKEAMDGLDQAKGKYYNFTYTPSKHKGTEYPIDRYFRQLKSAPANDSIRILLVKALIKNNRFEEAYEQLKLISEDSSFYTEASDLLIQVTEQRKKVHSKKIADLQKEYSRNPFDKNLLLELARRYSYIEEYDSSSMFYMKYLNLNPGDNPARFEYAKVLSWNKDYKGSKEQIAILLSADSLNKDYQLLYSILSVWMLEDLDKAGDYLRNIIAEDPNNPEALIAWITFNIHKRNFEAAEVYLAIARTLEPGNERILKLETDLQYHKLKAEEERIFLILEKGRVLAMENKCKEALLIYEDYLSQAKPDKLVMKEYADVNACAGNYKAAIKIYNELLLAEYDFNTDLQRAKVYYWSGDSLNALKEFTRLYAAAPENFDVRMYLGDTYTKMEMYAEARKVYTGLLSTGIDSMQTELINMRIGWLPVATPMFGAFPNNILVSPSAFYFEDNLEFRYNVQSLRVDLGITKFMNIAPEAGAGFVSSDTRRNFTLLKGNLLFRLSDKITAGGGYGVNTFSGLDESINADAFIKYEKQEVYSAAINYIRQDAAFILYSPALVNLRLDTDLLRFSGYYRFYSGIKLSGYVNRIYVSDRNTGYLLEFEAGKYFIPRFYAGYEFYSASYSRTSRFYFSPDRYSSHSITAEYDLVKEKINRLTAGGKIGLISGSDYILKEIYIGGLYSLLKNIALQGRLSYGSTLQNQLGYSSFSAHLALYWLL